MCVFVFCVFCNLMLIVVVLYCELFLIDVVVVLKSVCVVVMLCGLM